MDKSKMLNVASRAAAVMARADEKYPVGRKSKNMSNFDDSIGFEDVGSNYYGQMNEQYQPVGGNYKPMTENFQPIGENNYTQSSQKLPKGILDSFMSNPIDNYDGIGGANSVLDSILPQQQIPRPQNTRQQMNESMYDSEKELPDISEMYRKLNSKKPILEQQYQAPPQYPSVQNANISYELINIMIKNAVAEEFNQLKKFLASEGSNKLMIKVGSDIQFVTNTGSVYKGKLSKVGNINNIDK